ncbi:MAG: C10 family peptidase [Muribaculaceae bacterium]|nr:C10 family peptidase [Muribaculaceae bacterium]
MRKLLLLAATLLAATSVMAGNVDLSTAQTKAAKFLHNKTSHGRLMTSAPTVKWTHEVKNSSNAAMAAYYIVNTDKGYVIVAGDDRSREILAYGEGTLTDLNDLPEAVQYFLNIYQKQIEYLQAHPGLMPQKLNRNLGVSVEPMLVTEWSQGKPYNMKTPKKGYGSDPYCKVGCAAVALGQVMRFWEYPEVSPALPGYTCPSSGYVLEDLPEFTFDWANMLNYYRTNTDQYTTEQIDAVSWFLRYVGQAESMDYELDKSGAPRENILDALRTFGYLDARVIEKIDFQTDEVNYNDEEWGELIQSELIAGRPLIYCAFDMSSDSTGIGGHAFNVDGYDADNDLYHVNFGMSREKNAYYALNNFTLDNGMTIYDFYPILFADVQRPGMGTTPSIYPSAQSLSMECYTGETTTATFTVSSANLEDGITLTLDDANGVFSIDLTTIAAADAMNKTVTVTYAPQTAGTHTATITLTSEGADAKVVTLKGTATVAPLVVYDPVMLPADSANITLSSFRANWTDQTVPENVASYTLEVSEKPTSGLIAQADWSEVPSSGNAADYMPEGWVYNGGVYLEGGRISISSGYSLYTPVLDLAGYDKVTVVVRGKNCYTWTNSAISVKNSVDSKYVEFANDYADYTVVLNCNGNERIEIFSETYYPEIQSIKVYTGEMTAPQLKAIEEQGSETYRLITGITDKFYTVNNLVEGGTFLYKVKALYTDGTESAWSNKEMVTLFDNGPAPHEFAVGDVNHDGGVNISDVTTLIDYLLGNPDGVCTTCADVDGQGDINIADVTALIDMLLSKGN